MSDEVEQLRKQVAELRRQLYWAQQNNRERNLELDALHYVWCDGGCYSGTHRWTEKNITEEVVQMAERNTKRLRYWWENHKARRRQDEERADSMRTNG